jgi:hypothetical protein
MVTAKTRCPPWSWFTGRPRSAVSETGKFVQEPSCFLLQRVPRVGHAFDFVTTSQRFQGERRFRNARCSQVPGRSSQQAGSIRGGKIMPGNNGILKIFQQRWTRRGENARQFAKEFFIAADAIQSSRLVPALQRQFYELLIRTCRSIEIRKAWVKLAMEGLTNHPGE